MKKYSVVDLFAGAGGLSLGFVSSGKYVVKAAFENNPAMQKTYKQNFPDVKLYDDVSKADYCALERAIGKVDVVIGGPPCQGFSNANRQKNHIISSNNMLVKQYVRAILELKPKAFLMENVSMLRSDVHRFFLEEKDIAELEKFNIPMDKYKLHLIDKAFEFPIMQKIASDKELINEYLWEEEDYFELNVIYKASKNHEKMGKALSKHAKKLLNLADKHLAGEKPRKNHIEIKDFEAWNAIKDCHDGRIELERIAVAIEPAIMIQRMLGRAKELIDNDIHVEGYDTSNGLDVIVKSFAVSDYIQCVLGHESEGYILKSKVINAADYGVPQKRNRFVLLGVKKDISDKIDFPKPTVTEYKTVRDAIEDLEVIPTTYEVEKAMQGEPIKVTYSGELENLRDSLLIRNHLITQTREVALERFKNIAPGENFHSLDERLKTNTYTDVSRTQNTIYMRLSYDAPSGTVINVRKSMWIHPTKNRALSVREAARLQSFPDSFVFCGTKDKQYQQVGNAVPPMLALALADNLANYIS